MSHSQRPVFLPQAAHASNYPRPVLSLVPRFEGIPLFSSPPPALGSAFLRGGAFYSKGRYALAEALRRAGAGPGRAVLLPSYHCRSVVDAALSLNAEVRFYHVTPALQPDLASLDASRRNSNPAAIVLTHYFGFPAATPTIAAWCSQHRIALIEDCAHALYGHDETGHALGSTGQYSIASTWKFLPSPDGAVLLDNTGGAPPSMRSAPLGAEIKAAAPLILKARRSNNQLPPVSTEATQQAMSTLLTQDSAPPAANESDYDLQCTHERGLRLSQFIFHHADHNRITQRRRELYQRWLEGLVDTPEVEPLYPCLPEGVVPYAFPLLADTEGLLFHALRLNGIPIWRWEDMAITDCRVANNYRLRLLQLPCHQTMSNDELDWLIRLIKALAPAILRR